MSGGGGFRRVGVCLCGQDGTIGGPQMMTRHAISSHAPADTIGTPRRQQVINSLKYLNCF